MSSVHLIKRHCYRRQGCLKILNAERKTTKVGESIALELEENIFYMPERYNSLQDDIINEMVDGKI